ncbi:MAG TPA: HAMP domain-containing sensor histidine kinase [Candidatus Binataceae bacterium]|jgi:signal transduction histidine kinase|nr:HAMP domain-containing sensor histidine kinase [Candidatus Binataceae bacterium]
MRITLPALNLKAKLIALMVMLLALTLGAEIIVSLRAQDTIAKTTERKVRDLASVIQISVQELSSVSATDRDRLQNFVTNLHTNGLEVSIASSKELIINSSNPKLIGAALNPEMVRAMMELRNRNPNEPIAVPAVKLGLADRQSTIYFIPVEVEDHALGYVQIVANFSDFDAPLRDYRWRLVTLGLAIFALGLVLSYVLAERYVEPIHAVAYAAQNIDARGFEPVPEVPRRDEIGLLTRSFNGMLAQLRRAREREQELNRLERFTALGQLAGALAHEIKNPLNFISLALDRLRTRYAPQSGREDFLHQIAIMKEEIKRLSEMVQTFLHYGQPIEIHPAPTDLRQLIDGVLALSESKLKSQGIELIERGDDGHVTLNVDAEKLRTCFVNVVVNATQAMPEGGALTVDYARDNGNLQVTFADTGAGIEDEIANRVFEPFFTTKREGIGLGLFFSKAIVEKHGGTIAVGPKEPPPGAKVTFTFPLEGIEKST